MFPILYKLLFWRKLFFLLLLLFIQVRKFRESRRENTEEEDEEVREVTAQSFGLRLKDGILCMSEVTV